MTRKPLWSFGFEIGQRFVKMAAAEAANGKCPIKQGTFSWIWQRRRWSRLASDEPKACFLKVRGAGCVFPDFLRNTKTRMPRKAAQSALVGLSAAGPGSSPDKFFDLSWPPARTFLAVRSGNACYAKAQTIYSAQLRGIGEEA